MFRKSTKRKSEWKNSLSGPHGNASYTRSENPGGTHILTMGSSAKGSMFSTYTPSKEFTIHHSNPNSDNECSDDEEVDDVLNEHAFIIGRKTYGSAVWLCVYMHVVFHRHGR